MKIIAKMIVMRSRFFSTMLVPVCVEYTELAIISEMPVPLPECSKMKMIKPMPEMTSRISMRMSNGFKTLLFSLLGYYLLRIARNHTQVIDYTGNDITRQGLPPPNPDRGSPLHESSAKSVDKSGKQALSRHLRGNVYAHCRQHRRGDIAKRTLLTRKAKPAP